MIGDLDVWLLLYGRRTGQAEMNVQGLMMRYAKFAVGFLFIAQKFGYPQRFFIASVTDAVNKFCIRYFSEHIYIVMHRDGAFHALLHRFFGINKMGADEFLQCFLPAREFRLGDKAFWLGFLFQF